jgi:pyruvate formate lyase activating enzyme
VIEPFATPLKGGALLCRFCPRGCRLTAGHEGVCGALSYDGEGLRQTHAPGHFRLRMVASERSGIAAFPRERVVLTVDSAGSGLEGHAFEPLQEIDTRFSPEQVVFVARAWDACAVHLASDDPVFGVAEGLEILQQAHRAGLRSAVTTSGYLLPVPREILLGSAGIVSLRIWSLSPTFYSRRFGARVEPVLSTDEWLAGRRDIPVEVTMPLVPGSNDAPFEIERLVRWIGRTLGPRVPVHIEAGAPEVSPGALEDAREIARSAGFRDAVKPSSPGTAKRHARPPGAHAHAPNAS